METVFFSLPDLIFSFFYLKIFIIRLSQFLDVAIATIHANLTTPFESCTALQFHPILQLFCKSDQSSKPSTLLASTSSLAVPPLLYAADHSETWKSTRGLPKTLVQPKHDTQMFIYHIFVS